MRDARYPLAIVIRPATSEDADGIACTFLESALYHAELDPERYAMPAVETVLSHYRHGLQHPLHAIGVGLTLLVAELDSEVVGFIEFHLEQSSDAMHRAEMTYCHVSEIAVRHGHQNRGIGSGLLEAAEDWGRKMGAQFASLEFHVGNKYANSFYQARMGYHPASITAIKRL